MSLTSCDIGLVLLMAGLSKRMGQSKLDLPWQGRPLACHMASVWTQTLPGATKVAVVNQESPYGLFLKQVGYEVVINSVPDKGQAQSIRLGVQGLVESARSHASGTVGCKGVFFSVGDQPLFDKLIVTALLDCFEQALAQDEKAIVCPRYEPQGRRGNPVLFSSYWLESLCQLQGDQGGRSILDGRGAQHVQDVPIKSLGGWSRGFDIDTPEAYEKVYKRWGQENR